MKSLKKALSFLLCAALLLGCGLVPAVAEGADAGTPVPAAEGTFSFLNFNVAGLPSLTASSEKAAPAYIAEYGDIKVINGRYGPYIKQGASNYKIPKGKDAASLTEADCQEIIAQSEPTKKSGGRRNK